MSALRTFTVILLIGLVISSCEGTQEGSSTLQPGLEPASTITPVPNPDVTVCASGCDFVSIQEALEAEGTRVGSIIGVVDPVHTEAGIVVNKSVVIQGQGGK